MLEDLQALQAFQDIDLTGGLLKLEEMKAEKERLEQRSSDRMRLETELNEAKSKVAALRLREKGLEQTQTRLSDQLEEEKKMKARIEAALPPNLDLPDDEGIAHLSEVGGGLSCTLKTIRDLERKVADVLGARASQQQGFINAARSSMGAPMQLFLSALPEDSKDL
jgi:predicted nuclease with TOPRIM domain